MNRHPQDKFPPGPKRRFRWLHLGIFSRALPNILLNLAAQYGDLVHFRVGRQHVYLLNHPDFIQNVVIEQQHAFSKSQLMQHILKGPEDSLLTSDNATRSNLIYQQEASRNAENMVEGIQTISSNWQAKQTLDLTSEMIDLTAKSQPNQYREFTASTLTWAFYLLAKNPLTTRQLKEELDSVLAGSCPRAEHYDPMVYTRMIYTESLRLYPPIWIIGRQVTQEVEIGGYPIPTGSTVLLSQWVTHHDSRYYPDPYTFKPQRWLPEVRSQRPKMAFFPFGVSQGQSTNEHLIGLSAVLTIATVMQKWYFETIPGHSLEPQFTLTLRPKKGHVVRPIALG